MAPILYPCSVPSYLLLCRSLLPDCWLGMEILLFSACYSTDTLYLGGDLRLGAKITSRAVREM